MWHWRCIMVMQPQQLHHTYCGSEFSQVPSVGHPPVRLTLCTHFWLQVGWQNHLPRSNLSYYVPSAWHHLVYARRLLKKGRLGVLPSMTRVTNDAYVIKRDSLTLGHPVRSLRPSQVYLMFHRFRSQWIDLAVEIKEKMEAMNNVIVHYL